MLHVSHNAHPHVGGLEAVVAAQTRGLVERGWRVSLLTSAGGARPGVCVEHGVRVVRCWAWQGLEERAGVPFPVFSPWLAFVAAREVRRADLVHVHDPLYLTSWFAAAWCRVLRTPYVLHRHVGFVQHSSLLVRVVQTVVLGSLARLVLEGAVAIVPIDEPIADSTRASVRRPERVQVIGNGVDTELFRAAEPGEKRAVREQHGLPPETPLVLFVGRFVPKKGFAEVAAAASDRYDLVFVGGERPAGVTDPRLHFLGSLPAAETARVYRAADAVVVASVGECPLTVLESLSSGIPLILNEDPALHSPWTSGPGVRFVAIADGGLRTAAEQMVADREALAASGAEGLAYVARRFSWPACLERLEVLYDEILADEGRAR